MELEAEPLPEPLQEPSLEPTVPGSEETVSLWRRQSVRDECERQEQAFRDGMCHGGLSSQKPTESDGKHRRDKVTSVTCDPHRDVRRGH